MFNFILTFLIITFCLSSCGQNGSLYLPNTDNEYGPKNYSIFHQPNYNKDQQN